MSVQQQLLRAFRRYADRRCIVWDGGQATYAEVHGRCSAIAAWLQQRTEPGDRVAILLPNCREFLELILACGLAGRARVSLNVRDPLETQAAKLHGIDARAMVTTGDRWEELRAVADVPAVLLTDEDCTYEEVARWPAPSASLVPARLDVPYRLAFTGGTTGEPKAVMQSHSAELAMTRNLMLEVLRPSQDAVFVAATPLSHAAGAFVLPIVFGGGVLSFIRTFDPERLTDLSWTGVRARLQTFLVPTALRDVVAATDARTLVDSVVYGGAPCPADVLSDAIGALGTRLVQVYGQAEAPMTICVLPADEQLPDRAGCVGYPFMAVDVALEGAPGRPVSAGDVGEVVVSGDHVMSGYWRNEEATAAKVGPRGEIRTEDLGWFDERGRLWLTGRARDLIISGGFNVYPSQVERCLVGIDGVRDVAVFGVSHPRWGEAVAAAIVGDGRDEVTIRAAVDDAARNGLANFERPKRLVFLPELPMSAVGKVSRQALSSRFSGMFATSEEGS